MDWGGRAISIAALALAITAICAGRAQVGPAEFRGQVAARILHDSPTGNTWILGRDPVHPGGPGHMVQLNSPASGRIGPAQPAIDEPIVIHTGDRVVMEEETDIVHAGLEAVAIGNAATNHVLLVRVVIGGRIERAIAIKPGTVRWEGVSVK